MCVRACSYAVDPVISLCCRLAVHSSTMSDNKKDPQALAQLAIERCVDMNPSGSLDFCMTTLSLVYLCAPQETRQGPAEAMCFD